MYHSTQSFDYLWYLILRGKQKKEKTNTPEQEVPLNLQIYSGRAKQEHTRKKIPPFFKWLDQ